VTALAIVAPDDAVDGFTRPGPELAPIVDRVLRMPEHRHLIELEARVEWLMRQDPKVKQGRQILGTCYIPRVNGELSSLFDWMLERLFGEFPDFLIILDAGYWEQATDLQREILVFHELSHAVQAVDGNGAPKFNQQTGAPVFAIQGHDIEEFNHVVSRYGSDVHGVAEFIEAAKLGDAAKGLRRIR
jgi:hypothetical protein